MHQEAEGRGLGCKRRGRGRMLRPRLHPAQQCFGRLRHQLRALARAAFEKQQALAEHEAVEQERLRIGFLRHQAGGAIELPDILQPRRIDARHCVGGKLFRPSLCLVF